MLKCTANLKTIFNYVYNFWVWCVVEAQTVSYVGQNIGVEAVQLHIISLPN